MANPTMTLISSNTVGSGGVASVTFSSIPATYTDLLIKASIRGDVTPDTNPNPLAVKLNSTSNSSIFAYGTGSATGSSSTTSSWDTAGGFAGHYDDSGSTASTFSNMDIYIPTYTGANNKSFSVDCVTENNGTSRVYQDLVACLASTTAAITSVTLAAHSGSYGNFVQYSTFYLYGIKNS